MAVKGHFAGVVLFYYCIICMEVLPACMSPHHVRVWYVQRPERPVRPPETGIKDNCRWSCGCWKLNSVPLEEQPMLLAAVAGVLVGYTKYGRCCEVSEYSTWGQH